jgi:non-canonical (house-cleaning) NTP pyrophosphatase
MPTIAFASTDILQVKAINKNYPNYSTICYDIDSGLKDPRGYEIERGARIKAEGISKRYPHADIFIGIEYGIFQKEYTACIYVMKNKEIFTTWVRKVSFKKIF